MKRILIGLFVLFFLSASGVFALTISDAMVNGAGADGFASTDVGLSGMAAELNYINIDAEFTDEADPPSNIQLPPMYYFGKDEVEEDFPPSGWTFTSGTDSDASNGYSFYFTIDGPDNFAGVTIDFVLGVKQGQEDYAAFYFRGVTILDSGLITGLFNSKSKTGGNDFSHITAFYSIPNFDTPPTSPVPEPSTLLLMGAGIAGLAFYRRKRK